MPALKVSNLPGGSRPETEPPKLDLERTDYIASGRSLACGTRDPTTERGQLSGYRSSLRASATIRVETNVMAAATVAPPFDPSRHQMRPAQMAMAAQTTLRA